MMKELSLNIPLLKALEHMHRYARFMKQLVTNTKGSMIEDVDSLHHCSADTTRILQKYTTFGEMDTHRLTFLKSPSNMGHNKTQSGTDPGKHGHAKCHFVAIDIFTGKKLEDIVPSSHNYDVKDGFAKGKDLVLSVMSAMGEEQICGINDIGPK
ncbi:Eukaryotic translation initiation factor 5A-1 [Capsicum annuum]|uniref:Eukaryotic translation initiation factor 5A-1 n=1 Tax=Capsicum annuum TaxID=4072 RepID=A0A2G2Z151_CAPAN|nr:Eukaryotic translation initiation factor 5A-1 [Capsicum annuum]